MYINEIKRIIKSSLKIKELVLNDENLLLAVSDAVNQISKSLKKQKKIMVAGNGGSAADAQHFAAEFIGRYKHERVALNCISLSTDSSVITALSNDYSYESIFSRQIEAIGKSNDIFLAISTSGNSKNIINAAKVCKAKNINVISLTGNSGGKLKEHSDICINIPSHETDRIQEAHILIEHIICSLIEKEYVV